jgi:hypothetical protein
MAVALGIGSPCRGRHGTGIREHGPDNVAAFVQGKMVANMLAEAGLMVVAKTKKPEEPQPAEVAVPVVEAVRLRV